MAVLFLLRHGEIIGQSEHRFIGQLDVSLSDKGVKQAKFWRDQFASIKIDEIWCSDLRRCRLTAKIISECHYVSPQIDHHFREVHLGKWQGLTKIKVNAKFPGAVIERGRDFFNYVPEGGESFSMLVQRVFPILQKRLEHIKEDGCVLMVGHAAVHKMIILRYLSLSVDDFFSITYPYASCVKLVDITSDIFQI